MNIKQFRSVTPTINAIRDRKHREINHFREGDYLHVSDTIHKCLRYIAIHKLYDMPIIGEELWNTQSITFKIGEAIADYVIDRVKKTRPSEIYGVWSCACGSSEMQCTYEEVQEYECNVCGTSLYKYGEISVQDEEYGISGSIDLTRLIDDFFYLTEIKSISGKQFDELKGPKPDHVIQILFYWKLMERAGWKLYDTVSVIYVKKEYSYQSIFREYQLKPQEMMDKLDIYLDDIEKYYKSLETGELVANRVCAHDSDTKAKECDVCDICFAKD